MDPAISSVLKKKSVLNIFSNPAVFIRYARRTCYMFIAEGIIRGYENLAEAGVLYSQTFRRNIFFCQNGEGAT